mmetsp:Transcript_8925/g.13525  ORF Transcript_8925/g.13525 Transcript_8925/m.13525 type:complete len:90 (-) Transcript_8925:246-515(-)
MNNASRSLLFAASNQSRLVARTNLSKQVIRQEPGSARRFLGRALYERCNKEPVIVLSFVTGTLGIVLGATAPLIREALGFEVQPKARWS